MWDMDFLQLQVVGAEVVEAAVVMVVPVSEPVWVVQPVFLVQVEPFELVWVAP
jgi:hypothetical protein